MDCLNKMHFQKQSVAYVGMKHLGISWEKGFALEIKYRFYDFVVIKKNNNNNKLGPQSVLPR